jgi:hypothetical protein
MIFQLKEQFSSGAIERRIAQFMNNDQIIFGQRMKSWSFD